MSKFKVGDRIAVYGFMHPIQRVTGTVAKVHRVIVFNPDEGQTDMMSRPLQDGCSAHPKQCRKLVKKPRRTVWARFDCEGLIADFAGKKQLGPGWVEFREVRRKL